MNANRKSAMIVISTTIVAIAALSAVSSGLTYKKAAPATYKKVQAVFDAKCIKCHKGPQPPAKMNLQSYAGTMKGNDDGTVITAGKPDKSLLYQLITTKGRKMMPPGKPLSKADIDIVGSWIKAGAKNK